MPVASVAGRLVVYRGEDGVARATAARCPHLGADLAAGRVVGDSIECAYHRLRFDSAGRCSQQELAARTFATVERYGAIFVFVGAQPLFEFPAFENSPDLVSARPLRWHIDTAWFMVGANAFDARHFAAAHDRRLMGAPAVSRIDRFAMHVSYRYSIDGATLTDRLVRAVSGREVHFAVTSWAGNVLLVRAAFARDVSYGVVIVHPDASRPSACTVTVIVNAVRASRAAGAIVDSLRLFAKRVAIRNMLLDDLRSLHRLQYVHDGLRPGDEVIAGYLRWVHGAAACCSVAESI